MATQHLRRLLSEKGLSQSKLSRLAGLNQSTVNQIVGGWLNPRPSQLQQIADALGVSVAELTSDEPAKSGEASR